MANYGKRGQTKENLIPFKRFVFCSRMPCCLRSSNFNYWRLNYTSSHVELFQRLYYLVYLGIFNQIIKTLWMASFLFLYR